MNLVKLIELEIGSACNVGRKRKGEPNQDSLEVVLPTSIKDHPPLLLIADGMGGHVGGATASRIVIEVFKKEYLAARPTADYIELMKNCLKKAHFAVREKGVKDSKLANMGSTLVSVVLQENNISLLNVGDSRAYIIRKDQIIQISEDQSWVAEQLRAGLLTREDALHHPARNRLSMAITAKRPEVKPFTTKLPIEVEDILLLCSDGLWGVVPESLMKAAAQELSPQKAANKLVAQANSQRGPDNISVILTRFAKSEAVSRQLDLEDTNPGF